MYCNRLFITLLFKVLQDDSAGAVVPIDNLSMVVSIIFLYIIFKEKLSAKSGISLHIIIAGILPMLLRIKFKIYKFV